MKLRAIKRRTDKHYYGMWTIRWPLKPQPVVPIADPVSKHALMMTSELGALYGATKLPPGCEAQGIVVREASSIPKRLQCKDIPDLPILELLRDLPNWKVAGLFHVQRQGCPWPGFENSVTPAFPQGDKTPPKLVLAKMRSLIARGLIDGCACNCRGDFALTEKGRALVGARKT